MLLQLFHLTYQINQTTILKDIHLEFHNPGLVLITGASGSGKSTLLHLIGGLISPSLGEVVIDGVSYRNKYRCNLDKIHQCDVSFIFQGYHLIEAMTVEDNLKLFGFDTISIKKVLKKLEMEEHLHVLVQNLSGGQKQRIAIARVLLIHPKIILADEPTSALDSNTAKLIQSIFVELSKDTLVIVVSHDPHLFENYASRKICLEEGKIVSDEKPQQCLIPSIYKKRPITLNKKTCWRYIRWNIFFKKGRLLVSQCSQILMIFIMLIIFSLSIGGRTYIDKLQSYSFTQNTLTLYKSADPSQTFTKEEINQIKQWEGVQSVSFKKMALNLENSEKDIHFQLLPQVNDISYKGELPTNKEEIFISHDLAKKLDTTLENIIGQKVIYQFNNNDFEFTISGYGLDKLTSKTIYFSSKLDSFIDYYESDELEVVFNNYDNVKKAINTYNKETAYVMNNTFFEFETNISSLVSMMNSVLSVFLFILVMMNILMSYLLNYATFLQKRKEIMTLRVYGMSKLQIIKLYFYEESIISCVTLILGSLFSALMILCLNYFIPKWIDPSLTHFLRIPYNETFIPELQIPLFLYMIILLLLIIVNGIAIGISLLRIFKRDVAQILREDDLC